MTELEKLNQKNGIRIYPVSDSAFESYGRIVKGYDFSALISYMERKTAIPESGNIYIPSVLEMEEKSVFRAMRDNLYGGMDIQIGYCNGKNSTYNGFEYHKGSEINIAVTSLMLVLGHVWQIRGNTFRAEDAKVFFVDRGEAVELYQTTLHLSPCKVTDEGYKDIVVLPRGTNTPLAGKREETEDENKLLLMKNKWLISHPDWAPLIKQGAYPGLVGENRELFY